MTKEKPEEVLTCRHCGHKGTDVIKKLRYVGGKGEVLRPYCVDERACWERWDTPKVG